MRDSIRLDGKVVIVTGAARGLGRAMAEGLVRAGASVMFTDVNADALAGTGAATTIAGDITVQADCERIVAETVKCFGALHMLVNNAGIGPALLEASPRTTSLKFWEADPDIWRAIIDTNVNGTFLMARSAAPVLVKAGWGRIVNVTTSLPTMQRRQNSPYGVSKAAIEAETLIWAKDLAAIGRALLPPSVMVAPIVWLASPLSDGITGARFVGKLWDESLPPDEAAAKAREPSVLLPVPPDMR